MKSGSALTGLVSEFSQLVWLSEHKIWIFWIGATLISIAWILLTMLELSSCKICIIKWCISSRITNYFDDTGLISPVV